MNPFIFDAPVRRDDFFNRKEIMQETIFRLFDNTQSNVWLVGERQVGKTSFLQYMENNAYENIKSFLHYGIQKELKPVFIYLNAQGFLDSDEFYYFLNYGLKSKFDIKQKQKEQKSDSYENFINNLLTKFDGGFYPVFLIDEFDSMLETFARANRGNFLNFIKRFNSTLESIWQRSQCPKCFGAVLAANSTMDELLKNLNLDPTIGSGLAVRILNMEWFTEQQVKELADNYLQKSDIEFTQKDIDICYKYTQGYPYFTQRMFSLMYENRSKPDEQEDFYKKIKKEFCKEFENTIKEWGAENMPELTIGKLKKLLKEIGDKLFDGVRKIIETSVEVGVKGFIKGASA
jgi:hypothetical protein